MAFKLPLINDQSAFAFSIGLDDVVFKFDFRWNEREDKWVFDLLDSQGTVLVGGIKVVADWLLIDRYKDARLPAGQLMSVDFSGAGNDPGRNDLGGRVGIVYIPVAEVG